MIKKKKFSLSLLNSLFLIVFLIVVTVAILITSYMNTQKVVDKNIDDYFNQTFNLARLLLSNEEKTLEDIANKVAYACSDSNDFNTIIGNIDESESIDDIDLLFIKTKTSIHDYSNSLFDTSLIINEIEKRKLTSSSVIIDLKINDEDILLLLRSKRIVDPKTGRVDATFYAGKIFNDNFSLINEIKQKAKLADAYLFFENKLIASTNSKADINFSIFDEKSTYSNKEFIYSNKVVGIYENKFLDLVFVSKNKTFNLLQESFVSQSLLLLWIVAASFLILYYLSNKYIINPFSKLLEYAYDIKDKEDTEYESTNVQEFDQFADELKKIINELKEVKEQYSRAIDGVQDGLWDINLKNKGIFYSQRFLQMLGYDKSDKINYKSFWQRNIHKDDYKRTINELKNHLENKTDLLETEYRFRCKNGSYIWVKIRGKIFFDENGKLYRMTGFHTDINDLVILQQENINKEQMLYQQSKLASMGEMIGNIAHQWRQPLSVVSMIASSMKLELELDVLDKESSDKNLQKLLDTVSYLSSIIEKFRNFFNPNNVAEEFLISDAITENLEILESSYKSHGIELILEIDDVNILSYKFELMQVIINIISNARDALKDKEMEKKLIFMKTIIEKDVLIIRIRDNAGGIPSKLKEKIYEPYFTTKHQSQGTGLGLYMSNEITKRHLRGKLTNETKTFKYDNEEFVGEEFKIEIPC